MARKGSCNQAERYRAGRHSQEGASSSGNTRSKLLQSVFWANQRRTGKCSSWRCDNARPQASEGIRHSARRKPERDAKWLYASTKAFHSTTSSPYVRLKCSPSVDGQTSDRHSTRLLRVNSTEPPKTLVSDKQAETDRVSSISMCVGTFLTPLSPFYGPLS